MAGFMRRHKLLVSVGCLLLLFLCVKKGKQVCHYELFIPNQEPKVVWDVLADFSNIARMNTRITQWQLVDETGDMDRWSYRLITYEGMVGEWLFGPNVNKGEVVVEPVAPPDHYYRQEVYVTSSFRGLMTIHNSGTMNIHRSTSQQQGVPGTLLLHRTTSDCPLIFHWLCILETNFNRQVFLENLRKWFDKT
ncbi:hypothetical protein Pcinc_038619, partial [Petrolisthes cinctipes]